MGKNIKKKVLTISDAAELLCCSTRTIYRLIDDGELVAFHLRKNCLRITCESMDVFMRKKIEKFQAENGIFFDRA